MNLKTIFLGAATLAFLGGMTIWLVGALSKSKQGEAGGAGGQVSMVCPECHLRMTVPAEKARLPCPHCVHKGVMMEKEGKFVGSTSGARFYYQLFAVGLVAADGLMLLLCYYCYFHRPMARRKKQEATFHHCTCPTCHRKYKFKESQAGQPYQCHNCHRNFVFPNPAIPIPPKVVVPAQAKSAPARTALLPGQEPPQDIHHKRYFLIVANGSKRGLPIRVTDDLFLVGSEKECQLRSNHSDVAPRHFSLATRLNKVFVRDWNSGQPTLVNDALLPPGEEWPVHAGDYIKAGPLEFLVQFREPSVAQQDLEEWALRCLDEDEQRDAGNEYESLTGYTDRLERASDVAAQAIAKMMDHKGVEEGRLRIFEQGDIVIIRFNDARLLEESEIALVLKEIQDHVDQPAMRILLDFKNVRRLSAAAVDMLTDLSRWLAGQHSRLALCRLSPDLNWILATLNAIRPVAHFPDKRSALNSSW
jgi:hypothetical protein